jgi:hypothetical protein
MTTRPLTANDVAAINVQKGITPTVGESATVVTIGSLDYLAVPGSSALWAPGATVTPPPPPTTVPAPPTASQLPTGWLLQRFLSFVAKVWPSFLFNWGGGTPGGESAYAVWETSLAFVDDNAILNLASQAGKIANGSEGVQSGGVGCSIGQTLPAGVMVCFKTPKNIPNLSTVFPWWPDHGSWPVDQENDIYESGGSSTDENVRLHYNQRNLVAGPLHITWDFSGWTVMFVTWEADKITVQLGHDVASCLASTPMVLTTNQPLPTPQHFIDFQVEAVGPVGTIPAGTATQIAWFSLYEPA